MDAKTNFAFGLVVVAPAPAISGTTLTMQAGRGALMPAVPFNATVAKVRTDGSAVLPTDFEIVRVTALAGDAVTAMTRSQEGTAAREIGVGDSFTATITVKAFTDIEAALLNLVSFPATTATPGTAGDYSANADELALYVAGTGFVFFTGFQK